MDIYHVWPSCYKCAFVYLYDVHSLIHALGVGIQEWHYIGAETILTL